MELRNCNPRMRNGLQDECSYRSYYRGSLQGRTYCPNFNQRQFCLAKMSYRQRDDEWPESDEGSCFEGICGEGIWTETEEYKPGDGNGDEPCPPCPGNRPGVDIGVGTQPPPDSRPDPGPNPGPGTGKPIIGEPPITNPVRPPRPPPPRPPSSRPPPPRPPPSQPEGSTTVPSFEYTEPEGCEPIMLPYSSSYFPMGLYGPKFALCPYVTLTECSGSLLAFRC